MPFGKYELQDVLGEGSFGVVYKAIDLVLDRTVAIKVLHPSLVRQAGLIERFKHEARLAAQLSHPNIVPIYDYGQHEGQNFLAMGYMPGGSLRDLLQKKAPLNEKEAYAIFNELINGVAYAHSKAIVHRDLKPSNILFDEEGRARISDMGFAKTIRVEDSQSMSLSGGIVGTPHYMAPELWEGKSLTPAADQYSLGCILYEMLSGEKLFDGDTTPTVMMKHFKPIELKAPLTLESASIITRMTEKEPGARFASLVEVRELISQHFDESKEVLDEAVPIPIVSSKSGKNAEDENADVLIAQEEKPILDDKDKAAPIPKQTKTKSAKEAVATKANIFENPKIRIALIAALAILLLSGFALIGSRNGWFTQNGLSKTETAQAQALMLTQNWLTEQVTETNTATPTRTLTATKTKTGIPSKTASRTPTKTLTPSLSPSPSPSPTITRQITYPPTVRPPLVQPTQAPVVPTTAPVVPTQAPVVPTQAPVVPTQAPVVPTQAPVVPTQAPIVPTQAPPEVFPTRGPTPTPP